MIFKTGGNAANPALLAYSNEILIKNIKKNLSEQTEVALKALKGLKGLNELKVRDYEQLHELKQQLSPLAAQVARLYKQQLNFCTESECSHMYKLSASLDRLESISLANPASIDISESRESEALPYLNDLGKFIQTFSACINSFSAQQIYHFTKAVKEPILLNIKTVFDECYKYFCLHSE